MPQERRTLASVTAPFGQRKLTATLRCRDGEAVATWEVVLYLDDQDLLTGGYTYPLGEMVIGELGPLISLDVEGDDGVCWLVSAEGGRSQGKPPVEADTNRWVSTGDDGYWAALTVSLSES